MDAYQLEPLQKAIRPPWVNLFIAADVGLGKTIEAGLIARGRREGLKKQIRRLEDRLKVSQDWLSPREDHFRSAISCALQMMHADPLTTLPHATDRGRPIDRLIGTSRGN